MRTKAHLLYVLTLVFAMLNLNCGGEEDISTDESADFATDETAGKGDEYVYTSCLLKNGILAEDCDITSPTNPKPSTSTSTTTYCEKQLLTKFESTIPYTKDSSSISIYVWCPKINLPLVKSDSAKIPDLSKCTKNKADCEAKAKKAAIPTSPDLYKSSL